MPLKINPNKPFPPSMFKKGMRVRFRRKSEMKYDPHHGWNTDGDMDHLYGKSGILASQPDAQGVYVEITGLKGRGVKGWAISTDMLVPIINKREMKRLEAEQKREEAAAAEAAKIREAQLAMLPASARNVVKLLESTPAAFGCQRPYVIALCSAIFGLDLSKVVK
jgi:hypothetical protein